MINHQFTVYFLFINLFYDVIHFSLSYFSYLSFVYINYESYINSHLCILTNTSVLHLNLIYTKSCLTFNSYLCTNTLSLTVIFRYTNINVTFLHNN